jgi:hypothetical protein
MRGHGQRHGRIYFNWPVTRLPTANEKCHWRVKDTAQSAWRELPGTYTTAEMWKMRIEGVFAAAMPADAPPRRTPGPEAES